ncbi:MAG: hypothetical protein ACI88A_001859 [Paraglaciecola sp.]|jgi:hypothetical protein
MTTPFAYSTTYILDKSHFSETFDESITLNSSKTAYFKSIILGFLGLAILLFTEINPYGAWFIVGLGALEAFSVRFRKSWWLARQLISKAANSELTLTIDEHGVSSKSFYVESKISWDDVKTIEQTRQGWLILHATGRNYLSDRCLSEAARAFISKQALLKSQ